MDRAAKGYQPDPIYKNQIARQATEDPNKFAHREFGSAQASGNIPGESDRDRRLRLRAMEKKARLGSAKSNVSAYDNMPKDLPKPYQENVKFPENTYIEADNVQPARPLQFDNERAFSQGYSQEEPRFQPMQYEHRNDPVQSSAETLKREYSDKPRPEVQNEPLPPVKEMGGFPGLENKNDAFRQKQADMKRQQQADLQNYLQQNQNVDARKQRIQRQKQPSQETPSFYPPQSQAQAQMNSSQSSNKHSQIADEVFNEILHKKGAQMPPMPQSNQYQNQPQNMGQNSETSSNFMFKNSEEEERKQKKLRQLEYGQILRSQMGSAQNDRNDKNDRRRPPQESYQPIVDNIGGKVDQRAPKVNKDQYRLELERQIEERKQRERKEKYDKEQEDLQYQRQMQQVQQPGYANERPQSNYSQNRAQSDYTSEPQYYKRPSITNPKFESQDEINRKLQYQAELKAQIEENNRRQKMEQQKRLEAEDREERRKQQEQNELQYQYCEEEGLPKPETQGRPLDVQNRKKYFEPSQNNPIPSSGIKKVVEKSFVQKSHQNPPHYSQDQYQSEESQRTNPSTVRRPGGPQFPSQGHGQNDGFTRPQPVEPQYYEEAQPGQFNQPPPMNYGQPQMPTQNMGSQDNGSVNMMIEEQKKVIEMYQNTLQQIMEFQNVMKTTAQVPQQQPQKMMSPEPYKAPPAYEQPAKFASPSPQKAQHYMAEAEQSNLKLAGQLKNLYGELGTMLATKQMEMEGQSKFVAQPSGKDHEFTQDNDYLHAPTYKYDRSPILDQSLSGKSKFVKVPDQYARKFDDDRPMEDMIETWNEQEFDHARQLSDAKHQKYMNYSRDEHGENDDIDEDILERNDSDEEAPKRIEDKLYHKDENPKQKPKHSEIDEARDLLMNAMKDAEYLIKKEEDIEKLATDTHKMHQMDKVHNINQEMEEIERMVNEQNESNLRRKPMENSMSTIKSTARKQVDDSDRDPFDKLEDVGQSVDVQELEKMNKTAKSNKNQKRKPWAKQGNIRVHPRTDHNVLLPEDDDEEGLDLDNFDDDEPEQKTPNRVSTEEIVRKSKQEQKRGTRYDYEFENTQEQKIYETPNEVEDEPLEQDQ